MSDLIRRQDAIEALEGAELFIYTDPDKAAQEIIEELPEVTGICRRLIKEESGKWIPEIDTGTTMLRCSECGSRVIEIWYRRAVGTNAIRCPYCGARVEGGDTK